MTHKQIIDKLIAVGLRVTPQRILVYEIIAKLNNHPSADEIIGCLKKNQPNIATGTVYKVLDSLTEKGLIAKVFTDCDVMKYEIINTNHHHLYCDQSGKIVDYFDEEINNILNQYFNKHKIPNFEVKEVKLQILGKFKPKNNFL